MTTNQPNRDQLRATADAVGQRVAEDSTFAGESTSGVVHALRTLGVPGGTIADLLRAEGMEEEEVAGYNLAPTPDTPDPTPLVINGHCIGTCISITLTITWKPRRKP